MQIMSIATNSDADASRVHVHVSMQVYIMETHVERIDIFQWTGDAGARYGDADTRRKR